MNKIQKYTKALQILSYIFLIIMIGMSISRWLFDLTSISSWIFPPDLHLKACYTFDHSSIEKTTIPFISRFLGLIIDGIGIVIAFIGIMFFNRLMQRFQAGEFFTQNIIKLLSTISRLALCWAMYSPIRYTLLSLITSLHKAPGNRIIAIQISTGDIINIFILVSFVLITAIIKEGNNLKKEQDLTI